MLKLLRRFESRALALYFAVAGAGWAFFSLADEMAEGDTLRFDRRVLMFFREPGQPNNPLGSRSFEEAMRDVTALGGFTFLTLATIVAVLAFLFHRRVRHAAVLAGTLLGALFASEALKLVYGRPRPDLVPHGAYVYSGSFPSGHSMLSAATFLTIAVLVSSLETQRSTKKLAFAVAILVMIAVGISRVYLGVHWPSDVLAGWAAGAGFAAIAWVVLLRVAPTRRSEPKVRS
jgi:undecaprenyl-diphosphatase